MTFEVVPSCDTDSQEFDDENEAYKRKASHAKYCNSCEGDDVEVNAVGKPDGGTQPDSVEAVERGEQPNPKRSDIVNASDVQNEEQFVTDIKGVPSEFVVNMGTSHNKSIHIKKEGYYYLASQMDLSFTTEPLNPTWEGDENHSAWRGIVTDSDGNEWSNVGTAHLQGEDMQGAKYNLDELASTRAACRALSMATGTGIASMEEMVDYDQ